MPSSSRRKISDLIFIKLARRPRITHHWRCKVAAVVRRRKRFLTIAPVTVKVGFKHHHIHVPEVRKKRWLLHFWFNWKSRRNKFILDGMVKVVLLVVLAAVETLLAAHCMLHVQQVVFTTPTLPLRLRTRKRPTITRCHKGVTSLPTWLGYAFSV